MLPACGGPIFKMSRRPSNRLYKSGAQKKRDREQKQERQQDILTKVPKLTSFYNETADEASSNEDEHDDDGANSNASYPPADRPANVSYATNKLQSQTMDDNVS